MQVCACGCARLWRPSSLPNSSAGGSSSSTITSWPRGRMGSMKARRSAKHSFVPKPVAAHKGYKGFQGLQPRTLADRLLKGGEGGEHASNALI
eukprot:534945-Pelagomonas_calceolata.AAC.1